MEARITKDIAVEWTNTLGSSGKITILFAGDVVKVVRAANGSIEVASGHRDAGLYLTDDEIDVLLTAAEVAERTQRTVDTVRRWLRNGTLEGEKIPGQGTDGQWRVPLAALESFTPPRSGPKPKEA